jgi:hypothetical protein
MSPIAMPVKPNSIARFRLPRRAPINNPVLVGSQAFADLTLGVVTV